MSLYFQILFDTMDGLFNILGVAKGAQAEKSFAAGTEPGAGRADDVSFRQQLVKKPPRAQPVRRLHPYIGRVDAPISLDADFLQTSFDAYSIVHVIVHQ